tara:strand:- start:195 stop:362 length:168 start_codon:yes stop_codon:yes gene_type:complete
MMESVLSNILDKIETIDDLIDKGDPDDIQEVVDELWDLVHDEMHQDWLKSVMEVT